MKNSFHMSDTICNLFVSTFTLNIEYNYIYGEHLLITAQTVCNGSLSALDRHTLTDSCKALSSIEANIFKKPRSESE